MKKLYSFSIEAVISMHVEVEAISLDEAVQKAKRAPVMSLCNQCARGDAGVWITSGELDADPTGCVLVDVLVDGEPISIEKAKDAWES